LSAILLSTGRRFFGIALIAFGLQHLIYRDFVTRVVLSWPPTMPGPPMAAYGVGVALIAAGLAIFVSWRVREVAIATAALLLVSFVVLSLPRAAADCWWCAQWTSALKTLALSGGAWLVAATVVSSVRLRVVMAGAGRIFFAAFLLLCAVQHFIWANAVAGLVPAWISHRLFWTYFAGTALAAGAVGMLIPKTRRFAGGLTGIMIFSWVFLVHLPRAIQFFGAQSGNETTSMFEALAFSGMAFIIAASRGR
jgi:uncharacterized membrane protein